jgi:branched-chain amino acid transport system permease protein
VFYRQCGVRHVSYAADWRLWPLRFERLQVGALLLAAASAPLWLPGLYLGSYVLPVVIFATATLGLDLIMGRAGQIHVGYAAIMAVGAYTAVHAVRAGAPFEMGLLAAGLASALVGLLAGATALRVKGLYLAIGTLALQFLVEWVIVHVPAIGGGAQTTLQAPAVRVLGVAPVVTLGARYWVALAWCVLVTTYMLNVGRTGFGRALVALRERDYAAAVLGVHVFRYKLLAFSVSSFVGGVTGAVLAFTYYRAVTPEQFGLDVSIQLLAMGLIGGLGRVLGSFLGAAFVFVVPIVLSTALPGAFEAAGLGLPVAVLSHLQIIVYGALIVGFLLLEPLGLAKIYDNVRSYFLVWPFGYARRTIG